jgi:DNA repair exonuclease SbcCD ATPase subunit
MAASSSMAIVPVTGDPNAAVANTQGDGITAGFNPVPMETEREMIEQPTVAYFQFIQNNFNQIQAGNVEAVRTEAEQRHRQIMTQVAERIRAACNGELGRAQARYEQALTAKDAELQSQLSAIRAQAEISVQQANNRHDVTQSQLQDVRAELEKALKKVNEYGRQLSEKDAEIKNRVDQVKSEAEKLHDDKIKQLKKDLGEEYRKIVDNTVQQASEGIAQVRRDMKPTLNS